MLERQFHIEKGVDSNELADYLIAIMQALFCIKSI